MLPASLSAGPPQLKVGHLPEVSTRPSVIGGHVRVRRCPLAAATWVILSFPGASRTLIYSWGKVGLLGTRLCLFCLCRCLSPRYRGRESEMEKEYCFAAFALSYFEDANPREAIEAYSPSTLSSVCRGLGEAGPPRCDLRGSHRE